VARDRLSQEIPPFHVHGLALVAGRPTLLGMRIRSSPFAAPLFVAIAACAGVVEGPEATLGDPSGNPLADAGQNPAVEVMCSSGTHWTGGDEESPLMHPGGACIACHTREDEGPNFAVAGTVYLTPYEADDCNGVAQGAVVVLTDAAGVEFKLRVNAAGNFFLDPEEQEDDEDQALSLLLPYTARVEHDGKVRTMLGAQTSGDCNGCHTETGSNNAPGRVFLP
jgi:hypothetical protein